MITRWRNFAWRLALVMGAYSLLRAIFFFHNHAIFANTTAGQVAVAFLNGLRFDLSAIMTVNLPFVLLTFIPPSPQPSVAYQRMVKALFLAVNFLFLAVNILDLEFFRFNGRRTDLTLLAIACDAGVTWRAVGLYYWPLVLLGILIMTALFVLYGRARLPATPADRKINWFGWGLSLITVIALSVVAIRGGVQMKPLAPAQAAVANHSGLAQLTMNSSFTVLRNSGKPSLERQHFFDNPAALRQFLQSQVEGESLMSGPGARDNVVILVVESLSAEYCGAGNGGGRYTPFLDSLAERSLFFRNNYANGRRSIEVMPSILAGLPSLMELAFTESRYCDQPLLGLGTLLASNGYTTSFFHGATKGTMRFDLFMRMAGIQQYFGLAEYPIKADTDGVWGIFDEPYLQYVAKQLSRQKPPFAALVFTLSSHNPYPIPPQHRGHFKKGTLEIHESIGYVDYALKQFFATARRQPWYSNTLFVLTGDHTEKLETPEYSNPLGQHRVPLLFFHPQKNVPLVDTNRITQHVDILSSVLDWLNIQPQRRLLFGSSVFQRGEGRAFFHEGGHYWLVRGDRALDFSPGNAGRLFDWSHDPQLKSPLLNEPDKLQAMEREAGALLQYFNNGLLDSQLYDPK
jgi:phosphoglycerol transferase MdoB-like AlkP superfamily enzyme